MGKPNQLTQPVVPLYLPTLPEQWTTRRGAGIG